MKFQALLLVGIFSLLITPKLGLADYSPERCSTPKGRHLVIKLETATSDAERQKDMMNELEDLKCLSPKQLLSATKTFEKNKNKLTFLELVAEYPIKFTKLTLKNMKPILGQFKYDRRRKKALRTMLPEIDPLDEDEISKFKKSFSFSKKIINKEIKRREGKTYAESEGAEKPNRDCAKKDEDEGFIMGLRKESFDSKRLEVAKTKVKFVACISEKDFLEGVRLFSFDSARADFVKVVGTSKMKIGKFSSEDTTKLLKVFSFDSKRLDALRHVASKIHPLKERDIEIIKDSLDFPSNRREAESILRKHQKRG